MGQQLALRRSDSGGKLAGVCAGIAERHHIDPVLIRVVAVMLALCGGTGIVLYAGAWLLLPRGTAPAPIVRWIPVAAHVQNSTWAIVVGCVTALVLFTVGTWVTVGFIPTVVLAAIVYFAAVRNANRTATPAAPPQVPVAPPPAPSAPVWPLLPGVGPQHPHVTVQTRSGPWVPTTTWGQPLTLADCAAFYAVPDPVGLYVRAAGTVAPDVRRRRWLLVATIVAAALGMGLVDVFGPVSGPYPTPVATYFAVALGAFGLGLIAASWIGRPKGLLTGTIVLMGLTLLSVGLSPGTPIDEVRSVPVTFSSYSDIDEIPSPIEVATGFYTLDLSDVTITRSRTIDVHVSMGDAVVMIPSEGNVTVEWDVPSGDVGTPDQAGPLGSNGGFVRLVDQTAPMLVIKIAVVNGSLAVV